MLLYQYIKMWGKAVEVQGLQNDKDKEIVITVLKKLNEEYENHKTKWKKCIDGRSWIFKIK